MRTVTCVPILGFCAATLFSQTPPACNETVNRTAIQSVDPGVSAFQPPRPIPECELCALPAPERQAGANRGPIYRAIRALGSRLLPAKQQDGSRPKIMLLRRFWGGAKFRTDPMPPVRSQPCVQPLMPDHSR